MDNTTKTNRGGVSCLSAAYKSHKGEPTSGIGAWRKGKELAFAYVTEEGRVRLETETYTLNLTHDALNRMRKNGDFWLIQELYLAIQREGDRRTMQKLINALICDQDVSLVQYLEAIVGGRLAWPSR